MSTDADRELLEAAAKAAGIASLRWGRDNPELQRTGKGQYIGATWNPLTDDGDAFRLAVALDLNVSHWGGSVNVNKPGRGPVHAVEHWGPDGDKAAATRRAIVRAAAALART